MSMTAEERATQFFDDCHYRVIRNAGICQECFEKALRAQANAALEEAMAALCPGCRHSVETWEQKDWLPDGSFRQFRGWIHKYGNGTMSPCEAAAIRALKPDAAEEE